jgi:acyl-CoA reductase-like NAD-dependent aldehyde dehydrogenase
MLHRKVRIATGLPFWFGIRKALLKRLPLGNVLIIGTWNYPLQIHFRQILFALYSGNEVFFKPSEYAPRSSAKRLSPMWEKTDCVVFTGSTQTGRLIAAEASRRLIPAIIEASGFDSVVLGKNEVSPRSLQHIMWGVTTHSGETCVAPKILWYPVAEAERLKTVFGDLFQVAMLERGALSRRFTTPNTPGVISSFLELAKQEEAEIVADDCQGMILLHVPNKERLHLLVQNAAQNNILPFAPVLLMVPYASVEEIGEWTLTECAGLTLSTFGLSSTEREAIERSVMTSVISHEETVVAVGAPGIPFGGSGINGMGRTGGMEFLNELTKTQTVITAGRTARMTLPTRNVFNGKDKPASMFLQWLSRRSM